MKNLGNRFEQKHRDSKTLIISLLNKVEGMKRVQAINPRRKNKNRTS